MADETIYYAFEGDSSRLQQATQAAIDSLTLYESTVKNIQGTITSLETSVNDLIDWIRLFSDETKNMISFMATTSDTFKDVKDSATEYANAMRSSAMAAAQVNKTSQEVTQDLEETGNSASSSKDKLKTLIAAMAGISNVFKNTKKPASETVEVFKNLSNVTSDVVTAIKTFVGIDIASTFESAATNAMDYIENLNLFNVAMGTSIDKGKAFVSQMQEVYGLDPTNIMTYVGNFNQLASAIEMPAETAALLSTSMTKMATDVASVFNMDVVDVIGNLKSGILGMSRAVTKYGMDIRTTTLQQTALSLGITDNVKDMSEANREGLRYITMMRQASNLSGDWAKTIESPSNQLRILKEQLSQLARAIGNLFLPAITKVLPYINGLVMALREAITAIASFFGFMQMDFGGTTSTIDKTTGAIKDVGTEADKTSKKIKALTAPFDELNVLQDTSSDSGNSGLDTGTSEIMDPAIVKAIEALNVPLENVRMKANEVRDAILGFFNLDGGSFQNALTKIKNLITQITTLARTLKDRLKEALTFNSNGEKILGNIKTLLSNIYNFVSKIIADTQEWAEGLNLEPIVSSINNLFTALNNLIKSIGKDFEEFYRNVILPLASWTIEDALPSIINSIADALEWFSEHPEARDAILGIAVAIATLVGAIKTISGVLSIIQTVMSIMEVVEAVAAALGVTVGTLAIEVLAVVAAIALVITIIVLVLTHLDEIKAWLEDIKGKFETFIENVKTKLDEVKEKLQNFFQPFIDTVEEAKAKFNEIKDTIETNVQIIKDKFEEIKTTLSKVFSAIWNYFKQTIIDPIEKWFQEHIVQPITQFYDNHIKPVIDKIKNAFYTAFTMIRDFIAGIFKGIVTVVVNLFVLCINKVISFFEDLVNGIVLAVNLLVKVANKVSPEPISYVQDVHLRRIPLMAKGGVVSKPTQAIIGEGKYNEAVIPLGNSPQIEELLNKFADKVNTQQGELVVKVQIGDTEWDAFTYKSYRRGAAKVGATTVGGNTRA